MPVAPIFKEALQGVVNRPKCDLVPWDVFLSKQDGIKRLFPRLEVEVQQAGSINDMDLAYVRQVHKSEHGAQRDTRSCFFPGFPECGLAAGFIVFHEAGRQGPKPVSRLDGATAQQDLVFPFRESADHHLGVLVVDCSALIADVAGQAVASRDLQTDGGAAVGAEVHGEPVLLGVLNSKSRLPGTAVGRQDFSSSLMADCPIMLQMSGNWPYLCHWNRYGVADRYC